MTASVPSNNALATTVSSGRERRDRTGGEMSGIRPQVEVQLERSACGSEACRACAVVPLGRTGDPARVLAVVLRFVSWTYARGGGSSGGVARDGGARTTRIAAEAAMAVGSENVIASEATTVGAQGAID